MGEKERGEREKEKEERIDRRERDREWEREGGIRRTGIETGERERVLREKWAFVQNRDKEEGWSATYNQTNREKERENVESIKHTKRSEWEG